MKVFSDTNINIENTTTKLIKYRSKNQTFGLFTPNHLVS